MNTRRRRCCPLPFLIALAFPVLAGQPRAAHAAEPWADARLDVRNGLHLWLDAAAQPAAAAAMGRAAPRHDGPLDAWLDASGNHRDLTQLAADARPTFVKPDGNDAPPARVRFDGTNDCLTRVTAVPRRAPLEQLTLVLVAAPRLAPGDFRALLAAAAAGKNDYQTGLNLDLGPWGSPRFDTLNAEGAGVSPGAGNLFAGHPATAGFDLGTFHTISLTSAPGEGGNALRVDGQPAGERDRSAGSAIQMDRLVVGARLYSNQATTPPYLQGFFDGEIAGAAVRPRVAAG